MTSQKEVRVEMIKRALEKSGQTLMGLLKKSLDDDMVPEAKQKEILASASQLPEEAVIEMYASMPSKVFRSVLAFILNVTSEPAAATDPKTIVKNFMLKVDRQKNVNECKGELEQVLSNMKERMPNYQQSTNYQKLLSVVAQGSDEELIGLVVDMQDKKNLAYMVMTATLYEAFCEPADPVANLEEGLMAEILSSGDSLLEKRDVLIGQPLEIRDSFGETEDELMDQLNRLEYQRDEPGHGSPAAKVLVGATPEIIARDIQSLTDRLTKLQGGSLDRFRLRSRSLLELEHLFESTQQEINELQQTNLETRNAANKLADHFKAPAGLVDLFIPNPSGYDLYIKRRLITALKLRISQIKIFANTPEERARTLADRIREMNQTITILEKECDEEVTRYPDRERAIRQRYRREIDSIKEEL